MNSYLKDARGNAVCLAHVNIKHRDELITVLDVIIP